MTLLIACLLLNQADAGGWWYILAVIVWLGHVSFHGERF
jgi:hypothetical protein